MGPRSSAHPTSHRRALPRRLTIEREGAAGVREAMKFLLTNDDGIDAPGLQALAEAAAGLGQVVVAAPVEAHSGCSHRVTTRAGIRIVETAPDRFAVHGTPGDCVRTALHALIPDAAWVLAGVNEGGNLGADVYHSG